MSTYDIVLWTLWVTGALAQLVVTMRILWQERSNPSTDVTNGFVDFHPK